MSEFPSKAADKVNVFTIAMIGGVSVVVLWAGVIALQAYYSNTGGALEAERTYAGQDDQLRSARAEQLGALADYVWVDQSKGTVRVPIERAMELVVADTRAGAPSLVPTVGAHDQPTVTPAGTPPQDSTPTADGAAAPATATEAATVAGSAAPDDRTVAPVSPQPTPAPPTSRPEASAN